ncbi:MAG: SDR family oxidoreductase [Verrucomicrobia bacterium]|jgi:dTDP-4-dehydrorhamnose reductase|nr:SDR family oxidoreductase [Verrucomicrobiota bacterium]
MKTAWITGTQGLIGGCLAKLAGELAPEWSVAPLPHPSLDLTDFRAVRARFERDSPELVIHCAAISNTDQCERQPARARQVNVEATAFLADLFAERRLVFFSTDLVFDGQKGHYTEADLPAPLGVYARTKVEAEAKVLAHPGHLVLRTSINGGVSTSGNRGFNEVLELAWKAGRTTPLFVDEFRCPIAASVTARATWELALSEARGVYHLAGAQRLSRYQIGEILARRHPELNPKIQAVSLENFTRQRRAPDCSLDCGKAQQRLSFRLPGLAEWLDANPNEPF